MNTNNILLTMNKSSCTVIGWTECLHHTEEYLRKYLRRYLRKCLRTGRFVPGLVVQLVVLRALCWTRQVCLDLFGLDLSVWSFVPLQTLGRLFVRETCGRNSWDTVTTRTTESKAYLLTKMTRGGVKRYRRPAQSRSTVTSDPVTPLKTKYKQSRWR